MGFLKGGGGFDWNGNGQKDHFDRFMDMKASGNGEPKQTQKSSSNKKSNEEELDGISMGGKPLYDANKDSNGVTILKSLLVTVLCIGSIVLPAVADMGAFGMLLCIAIAVGLSVLILKNT